MITNERQHRITRAEIKRFEDAIARAEQERTAPEVDPRLHQAMIDGLSSQLDELVEELNEYDALRAGKIRRRVFTSLLELPGALIEGRIARRLTQKELAKKLGLAEQQIQRYEQTRYSGVSIERLQEVADAVGIKVKKTIEYDVREPSERSTGTGSGAKGSRRGRDALALAGSTRSRSAAGSWRAKSATTSSTRAKGGTKPAERKTGKAAASAAGRTLAAKSVSKTANRAAASDLAQVGDQKVTAKKAASAAGKTLASKSPSKTAKRAAASELPQAARKKKR